MEAFTQQTSNINRQYIELINKQIQKLDNSDFDLDAWKSSTIIVLERIFGSNNQKINQIEKIQKEFSSWSLRDTSGSMTKLEACKKRGQEILSVCIDELLFKDSVTENNTLNELVENGKKILGDFLTVNQFDQFQKILANDSLDEKNKELEQFFDVLDCEIKTKILTVLFLHEK